MTPGLFLNKAARSLLGREEGWLPLATPREARFFAQEVKEKMGLPLTGSDLLIGATLTTFYSTLPELYMEDLRHLSPTLGLHKLARNPEQWIPLLKELQAHFPQRIEITLQSSPKELEKRIAQAFSLFLINANQGAASLHPLFSDQGIQSPLYTQLPKMIRDFLSSLPKPMGWEDTLMKTLLSPLKREPQALEGQVRLHCESPFPQAPFLREIFLRALDLRFEEHKPSGGGPPPFQRPPVFPLNRPPCDYGDSWKAGLVLLAKNVPIWLDQLSRKYGPLQGLQDIPQQELQILAQRGIRGIWLVGLWSRSEASRRIKELAGASGVTGSAYAITQYEIPPELGGWEGLRALKERALEEGIRLGADMVPNHTALDAPWVFEHPDYYLQCAELPFPSYSFQGEDLSPREEELHIESGYYSQQDAAVVFLLKDKEGRKRYIYHGTDGGPTPWNDTAQLDYLNPQVRQEIIRQILKIAQVFPIIRFDAAMTLTHEHIRRLWYPLSGQGGAIPSRSSYSLTEEEFLKSMPREFWLEVIEAIQDQAPGTLLLAEAFWTMETYFVRTLGMHRVYNSAFMHLLRDEKNQELRLFLKEILEKDPPLLEHFVNFMTTPDEESCVKQFGQEDKYFGVLTLLLTLPGLPLLGHGQVEGFAEKYPMDSLRSLHKEEENLKLLERQEKEIFPLMRNRPFFAGYKGFHLFDIRAKDGQILEDVYAFVRAYQEERVLILYNNSPHSLEGVILQEAPRLLKDQRKCQSLGQLLNLFPEDHTLFFEEKKGLLFIYQDQEINTKGLPVKLFPYQTQLFYPLKVQKGRTPGLPLRKQREWEGLIDPERVLALTRSAPQLRILRNFIEKGQRPSSTEESSAPFLLETLAKIAPILQKKERSSLEDIILPAFLTLHYAPPDDNQLLYMLDFLEKWGEQSFQETQGLIQFWEETLRSRGDWIGANLYGGILWFHDESLWRAFRWFSVLGSLYLLDLPFPSSEEWKNYLRDFQLRLADSNYNLETLLKERGL